MENSNERWVHFWTTNPSGKHQITGRERYWWVSDHGRVKVTNNYNDSEYWPKISLTGGRPNSQYAALAPNYLPQKYIHKLVATYFCENPYTEFTGRRIVIDHIDGDKLNNHYTNLQWVTMKENCQRYQDRRKNGEWIESSNRDIENGITSEEMDVLIVDYYRQGYTINEVANHFNMTYSRVYRPIKKYKNSK